MIKLVIFDLDGTLLDTVADLAAAANHALRKNGFAEHPLGEYYNFIGNGINKLFERALPEGARYEENIARIRASFIPYYDRHNTDLTVPYPGIKDLLTALVNEDTGLAVASNKYHAATRKLVHDFFPDIRFSAVFGQREGVPVKPDPAIVRDVLAITGTPKDNVLFAGDSGVDMQTAANAGIAACGVTWGFRPRTELERYDPRHIVDSPGAILDIVRREH